MSNSNIIRVANKEGGDKFSARGFVLSKCKQ